MFGTMAMPVHNDVNVVFNSGLHHVVELGFLTRRIVLVSHVRGNCATINVIFLATTTIAIVAVNAHSKTEHVNAKLFSSPVNYDGVVILRTRRIGPEQAHTAKHYLFPGRLAHNLFATRTQSSINGNRPQTKGFSICCACKRNCTSEHRN